MQLVVFGQDAIINIWHVSDWNCIKDQKQKLIRLTNLQENKKA
jgi:hypothetical protein